MRKKIETIIGTCNDCGKDHIEIFLSGVYKGVCETCKMRKARAKSRNREYIPYIKLSEEDKKRVDNIRNGQKKNNDEEIKVENYYQAKAENQNIVFTAPIVTPKTTAFDPLSDQTNFINTLRNCGCEIPEESLKETLNVLLATDKLKDIFMTIAKNENQKTILDLEQMLNVVERKLQHDWEFNGFQEADDIKFKGFLTWRRILKGAIFFWKKLYQTNTIIEMQRAWNAYTQDPTEKIVLTGDRNKLNSTQKRFQITTESISTIFNTRRPFTRVFYAETKDDAYEAFKKWMADRQLHEDKAKTIITELTIEGETTKKEE